VARPGRDVARYHPPNFLQRHSAAGFSREVECATCHNTEAFCRSCHVDQGLGTSGRFDTGFHNENPAWVFGHGAAARQGLESCATCHSQRDCLECHSALGGRRVNPHASDFEADRLRKKNPALCLRCHRQSILDP
jgi:predicted CXXCH cytochrome family protein